MATNVLQPNFLNCINRCRELEEWCRNQSPFDPACVGLASRCISQCFDHTFPSDLVVAAAKGFAQGLVESGTGGKPLAGFPRPADLEYPILLNAHKQDGTMLRLALRAGAYESVEARGTVSSPGTSYVQDVSVLIEGNFLEILESHFRKNPDLLSAEKAKLSFREIVGDLKAAGGNAPPDIEVTVDHVDARRVSSGGQVTTEDNQKIRFLFSAAEPFPGIFPPPDEPPATAERGIGGLLGGAGKILGRVAGGIVGAAVVYGASCVITAVTEGCQSEAAQACGGGDNVGSISSSTSFGLLGCRHKCEIKCK